MDGNTTVITVCASNERMFIAMAISVSIATVVGIYVGTLLCKRLKNKAGS
ncbi:hypothetical protein EYM_01310 [Ignicoccus islandicus DSM 13165]|uniref:Uncharacterized protein n=1 Tax=Ignicoccus islandicus DSM 13165 TaxID=940295 RepID=A0A0U3FQN4_9CREN|nr:hypothetical protein [Ignicoccus islandicus]ALU12199.1 hypothetical protein EYM_01310 [Ignicoccus islandicus DSM 13165]